MFTVNYVNGRGRDAASVYVDNEMVAVLYDKAGFPLQDQVDLIKELYDHTRQTSSIDIKCEKKDPFATLPTKAHDSDAAYDLFACKDQVIYPGDIDKVSTGLIVELPRNTHLLITSRSGLAAKNHACVFNSVGVIDSGYRGVIEVIIHNADRENSLYIKAGQKIAQAIVYHNRTKYSFIEGEIDIQTDRGDNGFGSTDVPF